MWCNTIKECGGIKECVCNSINEHTVSSVMIALLIITNSDDSAILFTTVYYMLHVHV